MILSECLNAANEMARHGGFALALLSSPPSVTKTNVSMWVLYKNMLMDQQPSVCGRVAERGHVKRSYDGTVANELDVLLCERPHPWLDPTKLETLSRIA